MIVYLTGAEMMQLHIAHMSVKYYNMNQDSVLVDHRRVKRELRRTGISYRETGQLNFKGRRMGLSEGKVSGKRLSRQAVYSRYRLACMGRVQAGGERTVGSAIRKAQGSYRNGSTMHLDGRQ